MEVKEMPGDLCLKYVTWYRHNSEKKEDRVSLKKILSEPITVTVPLDTKFVHTSFKSVDMFFGKPSEMKAKPLMRIGFEVANEKLEKGKYRFNLNAVLATDHEQDWTPYFVLEMLCFV